MSVINTRQQSVDSKARFGLIKDHQISEFVSAMYRSASCTCAWTGKVERRGNAWAQTSKLRKLEREHLTSALSSTEHS
jgi:hypothetical protein